VRELVERGVWEYDVGYIPVTPRENRYLKLRDELELGVKAERYLRHHRDVDVSAPLGARAVIDASSGKRLRQIGPSPGDPPCPDPPKEKTRLEQAIE
jgi:hypothetical protein